MDDQHGSMAITLSCRDRPGIVRAVADFFYDQGCDIVESHQFGDQESGQFFMRVHLNAGPQSQPVPAIGERFEAIAQEFQMHWELHDLAERPKLLVMVSKFDHCLNDLLYRWRSGLLPADICAVVSNHPDTESLARWHGVPFHHVPVTAADKPAAEAGCSHLSTSWTSTWWCSPATCRSSPTDTCKALSGRAINIHHSFLPSFKGANPYAQAHARGVKLVGATAHYVTSDLDEGPIIEQDVVRVDHQTSARDLVALGRDVEARTLARAVLWHVQRRVLFNGHRTVVFT